MNHPISITVRCPVDGVVPVTVRDLAGVVVRSGSDVRSTYRCPRCGSVLQFTSDPEPGLVRWFLANVGSAGAGEDARAVPDVVAPSCVEAYVEYFHRELDIADTVPQMLALMDLAERPAQRPVGHRI